MAMAQHGTCSHQLPLSGLVQHRATRNISTLPAALSGLEPWRHVPWFGVPIQPGSQRWGQTLPSRHPCDQLFWTGATSVAHAIAGMRHGLAPQRAQQGKTGGTLTMLRGTKRPPISGAQHPCDQLFWTGATSVAHAIAGMRHGLAPQRAQQGKTGGTLTMLRGTKRPPISGAQEGIPWGPRGRRKASPRQSIGESGRGTARTGRTAPRAARGRADACGM